MEWYWILLLILIIVVALVAWKYYNRPVIRAGGYEEDLTRDIMRLISPYFLVPGSIQSVGEYLNGYYGYHYKKFDEEKLGDLIDKIVDEHRMVSVSDFIRKSDLTYQYFLPENKRALIQSAYKYEFYTSDDLHKLASLFKELGIDDDPRTFLQYNKLAKFRDEYAKYTVAKLKKEIRMRPNKVFEVDFVGILPRISSVKSNEKEYIRRIKTYLEPLRIIPIYGINTLADLEHSLRQLKYKEEDIRRREDDLSRKEREARDRKREAEEREKEARDRKREAEEREKEAEEREREEKEKKIDEDLKEMETRADFEGMVQNDEELKQVAEAMGMSMDQLYEQYKAEKEIVGGDEAYENLRNKLLKDQASL